MRGDEDLTDLEREILWLLSEADDPFFLIKDGADDLLEELLHEMWFIGHLPGGKQTPKADEIRTLKDWIFEEAKKLAESCTKKP